MTVDARAAAPAIVAGGVGIAPLLTLGAVATLGPLGTDAFLPALPDMGRDLDVAAATVQLTLSAYTVGMAAGQLVAGPLSDMVGRRLPLRAGLSLMAVGAWSAAFSVDATMLVACCAAMGVGASFSTVTGRAVISDRVDRARLARTYAMLGTLTSLGPILGPLAGVALSSVWGWRSIFITLGLLAAACLVSCIVGIPESLRRSSRDTAALRALPRRVGRALRSRAYARGATVIWFGFGGMFAYVASSSFLLQETLGMSGLTYAGAYALNGIALICAGLLSARLLRRLRPQVVMALGLAVESTGALLMVVALVSGAITPALVLPALTLIACSMGFLFGPAMAYGLRDLRDAAGTALGLLGTVQFLIAGIVAAIAASGTVVVSFTATVTVSLVIAWSGWLLFRDPPARRDVSAETTVHA
ncbi:MAG: Bcr/CflA family efflux MFS transporter [Microbacterium sp.]|uniref:Bcr/CflA family efflux MFS transporter n=1 Tax=Microbacterium sp. TaxID=51671 RepID=UPI0039E49C7F